MVPTVRVCPRCNAEYDGTAAFCARDGTPLAHAGEIDEYLGRTILDQFRIEERIGAGGMGTVYRARQLRIEREVAIKILHPELVKNPDVARRFQREARVAGELDHPNIVRVLLHGELPDGNLYIVMELVRGRSLADVIREEGPMSVERALHILVQVSEAIGEAHSRGFVHRDIKPENLVLTQRGRDTTFIKVLDFGIARVLSATTSATQSGMIFGTARYISPEGAAGEETDMRSDVYSIGVVAYQLFTGDTPFDSPSPVALLMKHIHESPVDIRVRMPSVPDPIARVVHRCLAKPRHGRYGDGTALAEALVSAAEASGYHVGRRSSAGGIPAAVARPPLPQAKRTSNTTTSSLGEATLRAMGLKKKRFAPLVMIAFALGAGAVASGAVFARVWASYAGTNNTLRVVDGGTPAPIDAATATLVATLETTPRTPIVGEPVTLLGATSEAVEHATALFAIESRAGAIIATHDGQVVGVDRTWSSHHTFDVAGKFIVRLEVTTGRGERITVERSLEARASAESAVVDAGLDPARAENPSPTRPPPVIARPPNPPPVIRPPQPFVPTPPPIEHGAIDWTPPS